MDWISRRRNMVKNQMSSRDISDPGVLSAFLKVPRHLFVPKEYWREAYSDHPIHIGRGQTISQPYIVAKMTELLELDKDSKVLEVGTGSGYQAAILGELAGRVVGVEKYKSLAIRARKRLEKYDNIIVIVGDGTKGYEQEAPYDAIIVTAAAPEIPKSLIEQLADGGRLVIPVGSRYSQDLVRVTKKGTELTEEIIFGCRFVPLVGEEGW